MLDKTQRAFTFISKSADIIFAHEQEGLAGERVVYSGRIRERFGVGSSSEELRFSGSFSSSSAQIRNKAQSTAHSAQRTAHSAQRTAHSAQRTAHSAQRTRTNQSQSSALRHRSSRACLLVVFEFRQQVQGKLCSTLGSART